MADADPKKRKGLPRGNPSKGGQARAKQRPAKGKSGPGWGGPAGGQAAIAAFHPGVYVPPRPVEVRLAQADEVLDVVYETAMDPSNKADSRVNAAIRFRAEVIGAPVQRVAVADASKVSLGKLLADLPDE